MSGTNFLEQLTAEYYELNGNYVVRNRKYGMRSRGGWIGEFDVVAIDIAKKKIVHIECCARRKSKDTTQSSLERKFATAREHIRSVVTWLDESYELRQIAIIEGKTKRLKITIPGAKVMSSEQFIEDCIILCRHYAEIRMVIPETHPIMRTIYFVHLYTNEKTYW
jgi:hypothetical protein